MVIKVEAKYIKNLKEEISITLPPVPGVIYKYNCIRHFRNDLNGKFEGVPVFYSVISHTIVEALG